MSIFSKKHANATETRFSQGILWLNITTPKPTQLDGII